MKIRAYKIKHGLREKSALVNERIRLKLVKHAARPENIERMRTLQATFSRPGRKPGTLTSRGESNNQKRICAAQILDRLQKMAARLGRLPTTKELAREKLHHQMIEFRFGLPLKEVFELAGLRRDLKHPWSDRALTPEILIELLRDFYVRFKRLPGESDCSRGLIPWMQRYRKVFGSMDNAYYAAGLSAVAEERGVGFKKLHTPADLEATLLQFVAAHGRLPLYLEWQNGTPTLPTMKTYRRYCGDLGPLREKARAHLNQLQVA